MKKLLWVLQIVLALLFFWHGLIKLSNPEVLPDILSWIYDLSPGLSLFIGIVEILAAIGLVLPSLTRIYPQLTYLAAAGLALIMLLAGIWHFPRQEYLAIATNVFLLLITGFVAYGRWRLHPIAPR